MSEFYGFYDKTFSRSFYERVKWFEIVDYR